MPLDIFGNQLSLTKDVLEARITSLYSSINKHRSKIFRAHDGYINFLKRRLSYVADPIDKQDVVTKDYLEKMFQDYYTKTDIIPYMNKSDDNSVKLTSMERKIFDRIEINKEFSEEGGEINHGFYTYPVRIRKTFILMIDADKLFYSATGKTIEKYFDVFVSPLDKREDKIEMDASSAFEIRFGDILTFKMKPGVRKLPVKIQLIMFGEINLDWFETK